MTVWPDATFIVTHDERILFIAHAVRRAGSLARGARPTGNGSRTDRNDDHGFAVDVELFCFFQSEEIEFAGFDCFEHRGLA